MNGRCFSQLRGFHKGENNQGPVGRGPYLGGRAPGLPSRGQNIENGKICDISTPGPVGSDEGP